MKQLCSELLALKAALEHTQINIDSSMDVDGDDDETLVPTTAFPSSMVESTEFSDMLDTTKSLIAQLSARFEKTPGRLQSMMTSLSWPMVKDGIQKDLQQLERLKSYFIIATTTENLDVCRHLYLKFLSLEQSIESRQQKQDQKDHSDFRRGVAQWLAP